METKISKTTIAKNIKTEQIRAMRPKIRRMIGLIGLSPEFVIGCPQNNIGCGNTLRKFVSRASEDTIEYRVACACAAVEAHPRDAAVFSIFLNYNYKEGFKDNNPFTLTDDELSKINSVLIQNEFGHEYLPIEMRELPGRQGCYHVVTDMDPEVIGGRIGRFWGMVVHLHGVRGFEIMPYELLWKLAAIDTYPEYNCLFDAAIDVNGAKLKTIEKPGIMIIRADFWHEIMRFFNISLRDLRMYQQHAAGSKTAEAMKKLNLIGIIESVHEIDGVYDCNLGALRERAAIIRKQYLQNMEGKQPNIAPANNAEDDDEEYYAYLEDREPDEDDTVIGTAAPIKDNYAVDNQAMTVSEGSFATLEVAGSDNAVQTITIDMVNGFVTGVQVKRISSDGEVNYDFMTPAPQEETQE